MNKRGYFAYGRTRRNQFPRRDETQGGGNSGASATQGADSNNTSGNSGAPGGSGESSANNGGQGFDPVSFWEEPAREPGSAGESQTQQQSQGQQPQQQPNLGAQLMQEIRAITPGNVFNQDIADQLADGNYDGLNQSLAQMQQTAIQQSVVMASRVMQQFGQGLIQMVRDEIAQSHGNRDNDAALTDAFPSARDPKVRPMIQNVFNQALKHSGGDRTKAIAMTRDMLKIVGQTAASDFGVTTPPNNAADYVTDGASSLVDELLGRN